MYSIYFVPFFKIGGEYISTDTDTSGAGGAKSAKKKCL